MKKQLLILILALVGSAAFAQTPPRPAPNPEMKAAFESCMGSSTKDANGKPNRQAIDACMTSKGFTNPPRHDGDHKGPPRDGNPPPPMTK